MPASSSGTVEDRLTNHLFIIDDDLALLRLLRLIFEDAGYSIRTYSDARIALDDIDKEGPDAVILDLEMPAMNGREFYKALRQRGSKTPVLILSAYGARAAHLELGAQGYLDKPFDPDLLVEALEKLIAANTQ
jgi:DNA-binding response OmpR family regulator